MLHTIQWRITVSFSVLIITVMTVLGFVLTDTIRESQLDNMRTRLTGQAFVISEFILPLMSGETDISSIADEITRIGEPLSERITVIDSSGTVIGDSQEDISLLDNHGGRPEFKAALSGTTGESTRYSTTLGYDMMYLAVPIISEGTTIGSVRVSYPLEDIRIMTGRVITGVITAIGAAVLLVCISAWVISRRITRPVRELTEASLKMASGELHQHIDIGSLNETNKLAHSFNRMSSQLSETIDTLTKERTRLVSILENIADGVIMTDNEGQVLTANKAAGSIFRIRDYTFETKPIIELIRDHEMNDILQQCLYTGMEQVYQYESSHYKRFLRVLAVPVKVEKVFGVLLLIQDLTELRSLQTMRRELIGNISHDFRTPLAGIKAMVETLQDGAMEDRTAAPDFLSRIEDEVDRLTQLVTELTELSRIETGQAGLHKDYYNINSIAEEAVNQVSPLAKRKNITITFERDEQVSDIPADKERMKQALINLIHNAVKFTGEGGTITVMTKKEESAVQVSISDTGIGIDAKDLPHIFERFYMADQSRSSGGSGMGLAIVKHIVEAHNGTIEVMSNEGRGTVFRLRLPLR